MFLHRRFDSTVIHLFSTCNIACKDQEQAANAPTNGEMQRIACFVDVCGRNVHNLHLDL